MTSIPPVFSDTFQRNMDALERHRPELHRLVSGIEEIPPGRFLLTRSGLPTLEFTAPGRPPLLAYGPENPWNDSAVHLQTVTTGSRGLVCFVGMGLGYGPLLVLRERPEVSKLVILEPWMNIFCAALKAVDLSPLIVSDKVEFFLGETDFRGFEHAVARTATIQDTHILRHVPSFQWAPERYADLDRKVFMLINKLNAQGGTTNLCGHIFFRNRLRNLTLLRHCIPLEALEETFKGRPAVLVAAGPSLDRDIPALREAAGRSILIAADSALAPLLRAGIVPNFVTSIDYEEVNFEKLAPFLQEDWPFSLVATVKVSPAIPKTFPARRLFFAFNEDLAHNWLVRSLGVQTLVPAALSVAHLSLGLALVTGADPIIFVGQDLAYTSLDADHAAGTVFMEHGLPEGKEIFFVPGLDGGNVPTDRGLLSLKKQFEDILAQFPRTYINASAAGAHIEGTEVMRLSEAVTSFMKDRFDVASGVDDACAAARPYPVDALLRDCRTVLARIKKVTRHMERAGVLLPAARGAVLLLRGSGQPVRAFQDLPPSIAGQLVELDRINKSIDRPAELWEQVLELTFQALKENDDRTAAALRIRQQEGYLPWLVAEMERMEAVNRIRAVAIETYRGLVQDLMTHLLREQTLSARIREAPKRKDIEDLTRLYVRSGDMILARNTLRELRLLAPEDPGVSALAGTVCSGLLDLESALLFWSRAGLNGGEETAAARRLAAGPWIEHARKYGETYPHLLQTWLMRVGGLAGDDDVLAAQIEGIWGEFRQRIEAKLSENEVTAAERLLSPWEALAGRVPESIFLKARCASAREAIPEALLHMERAVELAPGRPDWLAFLARLLLEAGRFDEGIARLQDAVVLDPKTATLWEELGDVLVSASDYDGAVRAYEFCLAALPHLTGVLRKIGDCCLHSCRPGAAKAAYRAVLERSPQDPLALACLEKALQMEGLLGLKEESEPQGG